MNINDNNKLCVEKVLETQIYLDTYGVIASENNNNHAMGPIESAMTFKFSIPEFYEDETVNPDEVKKMVKSKTKDVLFDIWKIMDGENDISILEDIWEECKVLVRVRKGETWTKKDTEEAIAKTKLLGQQINSLLENPYEEV